MPDKWMPPFRPSQLIYSEFPEDRARSLNLNRRESFINHYEKKPRTLSPQPKDYPEDNTITHYSAQTGSDDFFNFNLFSGLKGVKYEKPSEILERDAQILDGMNPPLSPEGRSKDSDNSHEGTRQDYFYTSTNHLEYPVVGQEKKIVTRPPQSSTLANTVYPINKISVFKNPPKPPGFKLWPGLARWKTVLEDQELSLQYMKPPPLGQKQIWARTYKQRLRPKSGFNYL
ncbi:uncharacterized protein LOC106665784 isoform X2 [Cimex lectularius]|uniref:Uncharacterized protein n=1 Tax=Cimex lectularius TaxID=79782 RepID=A0A8I6RR21_CIMLE|nr:uncharacterized protein LOC106665784 isoform X2 [Cimex lectularius]